MTSLPYDPAHRLTNLLILLESWVRDSDNRILRATWLDLRHGLADNLIDSHITEQQSLREQKQPEISSTIAGRSLFGNQ